MATELINVRSYDDVLDDLLSAFQYDQPDVAVDQASSIYILFQVFAYVMALQSREAQNFALATFVETASGDDLTALGADRGIIRTTAAAATALCTYSRNTIDYVNAYSVPASSSVTTQPNVDGSYLEFKNFISLTIPASSQSASGYVECQTTGTLGNVAAGTITNFLTLIPGIDSVTNAASADGGVDAEDDIEYRARIRSVLADNTGRVTEAGYEQFLEGLTGVATANVAAGTGLPNQITAIITSNTTDNGIPTDAEITYAQEQINLPENRAVVDSITVSKPAGVSISVTAAISEYDSGYVEATVRANVSTALANYINTLAVGGDIRVVDLNNAIHDVVGVADFSMSAPVSNIAIGASEKATVGTITIT